jgi:hypothetical protein
MNGAAQIGWMWVTNQLLSLAESTSMHRELPRCTVTPQITTFPVLANDVARFADSHIKRAYGGPGGHRLTNPVCRMWPTPQRQPITGPVKNTSRNFPMSITSPSVSTAESIGFPLR